MLGNELVKRVSCADNYESVGYFGQFATPGDVKGDDPVAPAKNPLDSVVGDDKFVPSIQHSAFLRPGDVPNDAPPVSSPPSLLLALASRPLPLSPLSSAPTPLQPHRPLIPPTPGFPLLALSRFLPQALPYLLHPVCAACLVLGGAGKRVPESVSVHVFECMLACMCSSACQGHRRNLWEP